jgi:pimeloyl-ACP methyl ester carboxylesterase
MSMVAQAYTGILSGGESHIEITPKIRPAAPQYGVIHLHGASGTAWTALTSLNDGKPHTPAHIARAGYNAIASDAGGPQTWGNQASIDGAERSYQRIQAIPGTKPGKVFLVGSSMGGLTALNWAAANPTKVAGIIMVIPVINVNDVKTNNRGGYASLVNAAHGGTYDEATMGSTKNPRTQAGLGKYAGIPILLFYGLTDAVCIPGEATGFAADVGSNVTLVPLNSGHDFISYTLVNNQTIIDFMAANG